MIPVLIGIGFIVFIVFGCAAIAALKGEITVSLNTAMDIDKLKLTKQLDNSIVASNWFGIARSNITGWYSAAECVGCKLEHDFGGNGDRNSEGYRVKYNEDYAEESIRVPKFETIGKVGIKLGMLEILRRRLSIVQAKQQRAEDFNKGNCDAGRKE